MDHRARVSVRQCFYSVPARYAGRRLAVRLSARTVEVSDGAKVVARHERAVGKYVEVLTLDHYLEVLKTKPGGLPGATALAQAKARGAVHYLAPGLLGRRPPGPRRRRRHPRPHRGAVGAPQSMPAAALTAAMDRAVASGALDPQLVLIDARREQTPVAAVIPIGALARYDRPAPTLTDYDQLLSGSGT